MIRKEQNIIIFNINVKGFEVALLGICHLKFNVLPMEYFDVLFKLLQ